MNEVSVGAVSCQFKTHRHRIARQQGGQGAQRGTKRGAHAATARTIDGFVATGGRVLSVVATGTDFAQARDRAYEAIGRIGLEGGQYRTDIAARVV